LAAPVAGLPRAAYQAGSLPAVLPG
jgi:hypothetical protein